MMILIENDFVGNVLSYFEDDAKNTDILCFNYYCIKSNGEIYIKSNIRTEFSEKGIISMNKAIEDIYSSKISKMYIHSVVKVESLKAWWYPDHGMITDWLLPYIFPLKFNIWFTNQYLVKIRHHKNNRWWVDNLDILREEKLKLNEYIENTYFHELNEKNQRNFLQEKDALKQDHINLLIQFKKFWRVKGIKEFAKNKITAKNTLLFIFWIFFGTSVHKYFIFFSKYYNEAQYKILSYFKN